MRVRIKSIAFDVDEGEYLLSDREEADFEVFLEDLESEYIDTIVELNSDGTDEQELEIELAEFIESQAACAIRELQYEVI